MKTLGNSLAKLNAMAKLNAKCRRLKILGDTLSEMEIDTLVDTLVARQAKMQLRSHKNTFGKKQKRQYLAIRGVS